MTFEESRFDGMQQFAVMTADYFRTFVTKELRAACRAATDEVRASVEARLAVLEERIFDLETVVARLEMTEPEPAKPTLWQRLGNYLNDSVS